MKIKTLIAISLMVFSFISCNKQPSADFTTDKYEYSSGETVKLTNNSKDAKSYKWILPDGQTSSQPNVNYILSDYSSQEVLTVKLQAISKKGNKISEASKSITVKPSTGNVVFWQDAACGCGITTVTINGITSQITVDSGSVPSCGSSGTANFTLKVGTYSFTASDGSKSWNGSVTITKGTCSSRKLI